MQPGEFTLPGSLRALPQRQRHSIIKQPCSRPCARAWAVHCKATRLGSAFWDPRDPNHSDSSRDVVQPNPSGQTHLSLFSSAAARLLPAIMAELANTPDPAGITQSSTKPGTGAEGSAPATASTPGQGVPTSQATHKSAPQGCAAAPGD